MTEKELLVILDNLRILPGETEWVEFKEARNNFHFNDLGQYFSALSNEANIKGVPFGWLVFGIEDKAKKIIGSNYRPDRRSLDKLKHEIARKTTGGITFNEIFEVQHPEGRVVLFQIPAAPPGIPVAWEGHYYGRDGESLVALNLQEIEIIRRQVVHEDWSSGICEEATLDDLDLKAIQKARENYKKKYPAQAEEVDSWDHATFLNKAKVTIQGKITRTAVILLGKNESEHFLSPSLAKISWFLRDEKNIEKDYEHFGPPFLLNIDAVFNKIRNLKYRYLLDNTLFPTEVTKYEPYVIREALNNSIAHQDYELRSRINVVETPDELLFTNAGTFLPGSVERVIEQDAPPEYYRNAFLANAMVNMNLIDTQGGGIKKMYVFQMNRYFPLPDYDLSQTDRVRVRITGKIIDENYTRLLINKTNLDMKTVIILDRVQKHEQISRDDATKLKRQRLVEGRYPNLYIAAPVAAITDSKAQYIKNRPFDDSHYKKMILDYIKQFKYATRRDIDNLLMDKLSDVLSENQKKNKIRNLISALSRKEKSIKNTGSDKKPRWVLAELRDK